MAAVKAKKPAPKKLKAGQKKKVNKWLILGGVAAVAIIGAVVVRFSSASTWRAIYQENSSERQPVGYTRTTGNVTITKGSVYRYCATGSSLNKTSVELSLGIMDLNDKNPRERAASTKSYGKSSAKHCSAEFRATRSYRAFGMAEVRSGSQLTTTSVTIEYLR